MSSIIRKIISAFIGCTLCVYSAQAQTYFVSRSADSTYKKLSHIADSLFEKKEYTKSTKYYASAFKAWGDKGRQDDRYDAAIAYAKTGNKDSAFVQLNRLAEKTEYLDCDSLAKPNEFDALKNDKRWRHIVTLTCGSNPELETLLKRMWHDDQYLRFKIDSTTKKYGARSAEMSVLWDNIKFKDSINLIRLDSLYKIYGWPGAELIGPKVGRVFWLIIQHSNLEVQEKYFPIMQQAVKDGKANAGDLAYLEDRILMRKGEPQKYGSQYSVDKNGGWHLYKLQDKDNVNKLRASVGLQPLSDKDIAGMEQGDTK